MNNTDDNDMKIYPVVDDEDVMKLDRDFKDPLQKPPFVKILLGSRGTGKTATLINEIFRKNMYGDVKNKEPIFNDIIVFRSTLGCDSTSRHLVKKATATHNTYDDVLVKEILDFQRDTPKKDRKHICIIADDIAPILKRDDEIFKLCSVHRHYLISIYFLIQSPRLIPPIVRNCYTSMYVYRLPNMEQQEKLFYDLSFLGNKKDIQKMYNYATNKPFQFLYVDALQNKVWKWGATQPELMWEKYDEDGQYNPPFTKSISDKEIVKQKKEEIESDDDEV